MRARSRPRAQSFQIAYIWGPVRRPGGRAGGTAVGFAPIAETDRQRAHPRAAAGGAAVHHSPGDRGGRPEPGRGGDLHHRLAHRLSGWGAGPEGPRAVAVRPCRRSDRRPAADQHGVDPALVRGTPAVVARAPGADPRRVARRLFHKRHAETRIAVNTAGKWATALIMLSLALLMATSASWPLMICRPRRRRLARRGRPLLRRPAGGMTERRDMKAVVMAGGEGTRLRPLTSNQPKPMVSLCGKPCMEHIVELLKRHGIDETRRHPHVPAQGHPRLLRRRLRARRALQYSVEQSPPGTAGSVKLAEELLDDTFIVISGDALTDFDLEDVVESTSSAAPWSPSPSSAWRTRSSSASSWSTRRAASSASSRSPRGARSSATRSTPASTCSSRRCSTHIPAGTPVRLQPGAVPQALRDGRAALRLRRRGLLAGHRQPAQYLAANRDLLDGKVQARAARASSCQPRLPRRRGAPRLAENMTRGRRSSATTPRSTRGAPSAPTRCSAATSWSRSARRDAQQRDRRQHLHRRSAKVYGAIIGSNCDLKAGALAQRGRRRRRRVRRSASRRTSRRDVKIYPYKTVEAGAQINSSIIWESRGSAQLFGKDGIDGAHQRRHHGRARAQDGDGLRHGAQEGRARVTSRDAHPASRVIKRAIISGLNSTGVVVATCASRQRRQPLRVRGTNAPAACTCASPAGTRR